MCGALLVENCEKQQSILTPQSCQFKDETKHSYLATPRFAEAPNLFETSDFVFAKHEWKAERAEKGKMATNERSF